MMESLTLFESMKYNNHKPLRKGVKETPLIFLKRKIVK